MKKKTRVIKTPEGTFTVAAGGRLSSSEELDILHDHAVELYRAAQFNECLQVMHQLHQVRHDNPEYLHTFGLALSGVGHHLLALSVLKRTVALAPGNVRFRLSLGFAQMRSGNPAQAEVTFEGALSSFPDDPDLLSDLACCLVISGKSYQRAEQLLRRALGCQANEQFLLSNLGQVLWYQGRLAEAEREFNRGIEIDPTSHLADVIRHIQATLARTPPPIDPSLN